VLMPGADIAVAVRRAEQLRSKVEALVVRYLEQNLPTITISIGVAAFPEAGDDPQVVLKVADEALYRAKEGGRNRVEVSSEAGTASAEVQKGHPVAMQRALAASFYVPDHEEVDKRAASLADGS
jgi:predicted signal transduction protein with EAL and GGDEF domain